MSYDHHILTELASHLFPLPIPFRDEFLMCQAKSFIKRTDPNTTSLGRHGKLTKKKKQPVKHKTENLAGDQSEPTRQRLFIWVLFCLRGWEVSQPTVTMKLIGEKACHSILK